MKFVVLFLCLFCVVSAQSYRSRYCDICRNHTLCKYSLGGPTAACRNFDKEALLTEADIAEILNRINARRNLVAVGRLKKFPQAANMRKVQWSTELASFAQRWADQCDPSVRPNKEDECRDLVTMLVGQSVAAVVGPAPGLNVKSFVDMWFMLKLHYKGNVVYFNQSRDGKTKYFTQLIWADTEYVGCGKVKFLNQEINTIVERLVCNFAPKGNNHGKPVYALGLPATQCLKFMSPDSEFSGLCIKDHVTETEIVPKSTASSLLRILDSSNSSAKQDLDPNNLKQIGSNSSEIRDQRIQKIRHAYINDSNGAIKRDSYHMQNSHFNPLNDVDNFKGQSFTPERGHSRMYHGHQTKTEPIQNFHTTQSFSEQDFRRFHLTTTSNPLSIQHNHDHAPRIINSQNDYVPDGRRIIINQNDYVPDSRRIIQNQNDYAPDGRRIISDQNDYTLDGRRKFADQMCTRKPKCNDCIPKPCGSNQCTRGQSHSCSSCLKPQPCNLCLQRPLSPSPLSHDLCPCKATCPPVPSPIYPVCPSHNCGSSDPPSICAKRRAQGDAQDTTASTQYNYYDLFPNIGLRSGDGSEQKTLNNFDDEDGLQYKAKESEINNQVKEIGSNLQMRLHKPQDSHDIFYSSERKRRDFEDQMTFKPFWQMDEYNHKRPSELKSLRYTTLPDRRNKKSRWPIAMKLPTESITIKSNDELIHNGHHRDHVTEKYLSFEELMHLRKLTTLEALDYEVRRFGDDVLRASATTKKATVTTKAAVTKKAAVTTKAVVTAKAAVTTKAAVATKTAVTAKAAAAATTTVAVPTITANTPFIRMKQCTRKITCTWTALMFMTGADGSPLTGVPNGAGGVIYNVEVGSRTPPGYVDGCTRTSTCTRDFMDRNIMPIQTGEDTGGDENYSSSNDSSTLEDDEYCEKRSLNVQRRNLDDSDKILSIDFQEALTEITPTPEIRHVTNRGIVDDTEVPRLKHSDCMCYEDYSRIKREEIGKYEKQVQKNCNNQNTINQDTNCLYSVLRKKSFGSKSDKTPLQCACSGTKSIYDTLFWMVFLNYSLIWLT